MIDETCGDIVIDNVSVHGYLQSGMHVGSFVRYAGGKITISNCASDATLVCTAANMACLIGHPQNQEIIINNTTFTGLMYYAGSTTSCYKWVGDWSPKDSTVTVDGVALVGESNWAKAYDQTKCFHIDVEIGTRPSMFSTYSVNKLPGYSYAIAYMSIGPDGNGIDVFGTDFLSNYMIEDSREDGLVVDATTITTKNIKYYNVTCNGDSTSTTGVSSDGHTFNIVNSKYNNAISEAEVRIAQYDSTNSIIGITKFDMMPDKIYLSINGEDNGKVYIGMPYTYTANENIEGKVRVYYVNRDASWCYVTKTELDSTQYIVSGNSVTILNVEARNIPDIDDMYNYYMGMGNFADAHQMLLIEIAE